MVAPPYRIEGESERDRGPVPLKVVQAKEWSTWTPGSILASIRNTC